MNDDPRLRRAFQDAVLPPAPEALHARLEEIARRPAPAPRALPGRLGLLVAAAAIALVVLALALSGGGLTLTPTGTPSSPPTGLAHFDEGGLVFDYPAGWRVYHYQEVSSFTSVVAFLATVDVPIPCATTVTSDSTEIDCADRFVLAPDSLVVTVMANGMPAFDINNVPAGATPLVVGGLPAYFETEPVPSGGDTETLTWTLSRPGSVDNYYAIRAAIRGPHLGPFEAALHDLIAGLRYNPPVVPLPTAVPPTAAVATDAPVPSMPPFTGDPTLRVGSGPAVERTGTGGCTEVFYLAVGVGGSTCGPSVFVLDAPAQAVQRGELLTITAPTGWSFSGAAVGVQEAWSMTIAPVSALANLGENDQAEIPAGLGTVLGSGAGPDQVATAAAPTSPGEYLLQFRDELARDGWTLDGVTFFWRLSIK